MYLAIKTESSEAVLIALDEHGSEISKSTWQAGRELSQQLLPSIAELIINSGNEWNDIKGIIVFRGPGSFTGLRIGCTVANAIAYTQNTPIVGTTSEDWLNVGCRRLMDGDDDKQVVPEYGSDPNITKPGPA